MPATRGVHDLLLRSTARRWRSYDPGEGRGIRRLRPGGQQPAESRGSASTAVPSQRESLALSGGGQASWIMTFTPGYALTSSDSLEELGMGGGSTLWLKVTGEESRRLVTVLSGVVHSGGTPLHIHESEGEVVIVIKADSPTRQATTGEP